ncbi:MAG TPA: alkaline phosphatase D family protein [Candidatus Obscuribacterales bacterium]
MVSLKDTGARAQLTMQRRRFLLVSAFSLLSLGCHALTKGAAAADRQKVIKRVAFGSCARQDRPQPIWDVIAAARPDLFLFIGDNVYGDTEDMSVLAKKYRELAAKPEFGRFRARVPILATWDDHDFGVNDGGVEYPKKEESKRAMLDFFGEPPESERWRRPGVYTAYCLGPAGKRVQLILLDLRWFRTALVHDPANGGYLANEDSRATMLGCQQWAWLEQELRKPAELRIIASSTQFSSPDHRFEKWANFPREKERMLRLLDRLNIRNALIISGDMHYGELSSEQTPAGFTLYDLTSSGLNQHEPGAHLPNRNRIAIYDQSANFGFVEIDWDSSPVAVSLQVRDVHGRAVIRRDVSY